MAASNRVYLLTGSNIEPRSSHLQKAAKLIDRQIGSVLKRSFIYESEPWGFETNTKFLNQVLIVETPLEPVEVLKQILSMEKGMGRNRGRNQNGYTSRTIDIDILYYNDLSLNSENLVIPHPRLHLRRFTLVPLAEIAGNMIHPVFKRNTRELLAACEDASPILKFETE